LGISARAIDKGIIFILDLSKVRPLESVFAIEYIFPFDIKQVSHSNEKRVGCCMRRIVVFSNL
jgi:hypothetical protein